MSGDKGGVMLYLAKLKAGSLCTSGGAHEGENGSSAESKSVGENSG
jgi:hypothetical protein